MVRFGRRCNFFFFLFRYCDGVLLGLSLLNGHGYSGGQREVSLFAAIVVEGGGMDGRKWVGLCEKGEAERKVHTKTHPRGTHPPIASR